MVLCLKTWKSRTLPGISKMKNLIIVTGGAGFVGSNLVEFLIKKTKYQIISLDNYSSGTKKNHIKHKRIKYLKGSTTEIKKILDKYKNNIKSIFHFGEFSRIYQSFKKFNECYQSNSVGSLAVFKFCLDNKIKLIYSATSASLGNNGNDKNLSPYAFTKSKNLELLDNLKKWFNFKFEIIFFYNVYGPRQIKVGDMATVIGIFENQYLKKKPLTVVKPGNQTRRFTHIFDTVQVCYEAFKSDKCRHYSISNKNSYSILQVAKMFKSKIILLKPRLGERYASALTKISNNNKIIQKFGKLQLKDYVSSFINSH
jgi:UDP-glucose 4-epimerase